MDSVNSIPKSRRKPVGPQPSNPRTSPNTRHEAKRPTSLADIGTELCEVLMELERVQSYIVVARKALEGGIDPADDEVFARRTDGDSLFRQIRTLQDVAARYGRRGHPSDCYSRRVG